MRLLKGELPTKLLVWTVTLSVLMNPILTDDNDDDEDDDDNDDEEMTVCQEEDHDLRVTCPLRPKPNYHTEFEFSMSKGRREVIVNTNVSGTMPDSSFRHNTYVEELDPYGFKLIIMSFTLTENTTFICRVTNEDMRLFVDVDALQHCSAICVFLQSYPWLLSLLLPLCILQTLEAL
ncbi:thy-1 membrane glycoprotein-like [Tachysurus vachellii]|uniref:thy-1 membrane glycoprotein-like n=1 Tax=Tachysurus vachellii TaxID=175792 RepID=UPI00296B3601|nr:thy-1 membrane glycoprotein-like [Tachysurus vachellii]